MPHSIKKMELAGGDLTDYLVKILQENHINLSTPNEMDCAASMKEELCRVALDFEGEMKVTIHILVYYIPILYPC